MLHERPHGNMPSEHKLNNKRERRYEGKCGVLLLSGLERSTGISTMSVFLSSHYCPAILATSLDAGCLVFPVVYRLKLKAAEEKEVVRYCTYFQLVKLVLTGAHVYGGQEVQHNLHYR